MLAKVLVAWTVLVKVSENGLEGVSVIIEMLVLLEDLCRLRFAGIRKNALGKSDGWEYTTRLEVEGAVLYATCLVIVRVHDCLRNCHITSNA
jgi:hypothetical protein